MEDKAPSYDLLFFYENEVLPALHGQLDRAFPELEWTWTGDGWKGVRKSENGVYNRFDRTAIVANHPWGFVTRAGTATSWLAYINGGQTPTGPELQRAVFKLAELAGVAPPRRPLRLGADSEENAFVESASSPTPIHHHIPPRELELTHLHPQRQTELWEAFAAFCHGCLLGETGRQVRHQLEREFGIDAVRTDYLPLGFYPTADDIHAYLSEAGFEPEEIDASAVCSDTRLHSRVIIPWRDSLGRLATLIAEDVNEEEASGARRLYIKGGYRPAMFGLDVALRPSAGGSEHLILVDRALDVVFFQQHGLPNVAMMGSASKSPTKRDWEILADLGVQSVTLALSDDAGGCARACKSLIDAQRADDAPEVSALPFGCLETCHHAGDFARGQGLHRFRSLVVEHQPALAYLGAALVRRHRPGRKFNDSTAAAALREAVAFDAAVFRPQREEALDRHFWGEVLKAIHVSWGVVRPRLTHRPQPVKQKTAPPKHVWQNDPSPAAPPRWPVVSKEKDVDWINVALQAAAEEEAERWQADWQHEQPQQDQRLPRRTSPQRAARYQSGQLSYDDIRVRAYQLWEQKGRPFGADEQCWYEAEQSLRRRPSARESTNGFRAA